MSRTLAAALIVAVMLIGVFHAPVWAGSTILAAAVIDDVLGLVILAFVTAAESGRHPAALPGGPGVIFILGRVLVFLLLGLGLGPVLVRSVFTSRRRVFAALTARLRSLSSSPCASPSWRISSVAWP